MKRDKMLTITSLLSILLLTLHLADDILLVGPRGLTNLTGIAFLLLFLVGTLLLDERRSGYFIMILCGLTAAGMPVLHLWYGIGKARGLLFVFGLLALGVLGGFTMILAARDLWNGRRRE